MCEHDGTFKSQISVRLAHPRSDGIGTAGVDPCIAPIENARSLRDCCTGYADGRAKPRGAARFPQDRR